MSLKKTLITSIIVLLMTTVFAQSGLNVGGSNPQENSIHVIFKTNWTVTGSENYSNKIVIHTGNLTVTGSGLLKFTNVTLIMNVNSSDGDYGITVQGGGRFYVNDTDGDSLTIVDRSIITNNATGLGYSFQVDDAGVFEMRNSRLEGCGLFGTQPGANESGMKVLSDYVKIIGSEITDCSNGLYVDSANPLVVNSTIHANTQNGIYYSNVTDPSHHFNLTLQNVTINNNLKAGLYLLGDTADVFLDSNYIHHNARGGVRINAGHSVNATVTNNKIQYNTGKGGVGMWGLPGVCVIRANVSGNNISQNSGVSSLLIGFVYSDSPAGTVFLNATDNDIWVSNDGEDPEGDGLILVYATNYIYANISNNNIIGPFMQNGIHIGKVLPDVNPNPGCKIVDAHIINNELVNIQGGALRVTSTEELNANVTGNHIYHPYGSMGCGSVSLGWYAENSDDSTPKNATLMIRDNLFQGIADSGGMALKAIYNLNATIEGNVLDKINNVGVNEWGFKLGWVADADSRLLPSPDGYPTRNVRALIRNNTIVAGTGPGIWVYSSNGTSIHDNTISGRNDGIKVQATNGNTLIFNNSLASCTGAGIRMHSSKDVSVFGNALSNNFYGLAVDYSSKNNIFFNNTITKTSSKYGFYVNTNSMSHQFPANNTVNGKWFRYYHNLQGTPASHQVLQGHNVQEPLMSNLGQVVIVNSTYVDVENNVITNGTNGLVLLKSNNTLVRDNYIGSNSEPYSQSIGSGVLFRMGSHNNSVVANEVVDNTYGIKFEDSSVDNSIWGNNISKTDVQTGIYLDPAGTSFRNILAINNSVDGSPVHYYFMREGIQIKNQTIEEKLTTNLGQYVLLNTKNVSLDNITVLNGTNGLFINASDNITLENSYLGLNTYNLNILASTNISLNNVTLENGTASIRLTSTSPVIHNSNIDSGAGLAFNLTDGNCHPVLFNTTYNHSLVKIFNGSDITMKWFLGINVMANNAPCEGANITVLNATGITQYNLTTGPDGRVSGLVLIEMINTSAYLKNLSLYSISVQKANFSASTQNIVMNRSIELLVNLTDISAPAISIPSVEPASLGTSIHFVWLNATLTDVGHGDSPIAYAEWYISRTTPSIMGTGLPISAVDGGFDEKTEDVSVRIDVDNWAVGDHKVWIHGRDIWGNWCGWTSAAFTIFDDECPVITLGPTLDTTLIGTSERKISIVTVVDDTGYGNSRVFGVEWSILQGNEPVIDSFNVLTSTIVVDGNYDESNETIKAEIDITFWETGNYTFQIRGFDEYGNYGSWNAIDFQLVDDIAPNTPSNLLAVDTDGGLLLTWSPNTELDLAGYKIYRTTSSGSGYTLVSTLGPGVHTWTDVEVVADVEYYYVITAFDNAVPPNESPFSSEARGLSQGESETAQGGYWLYLIFIIVLLAILVMVIVLRMRQGKKKEPAVQPKKPEISEINEK